MEYKFEAQAINSMPLKGKVEVTSRTLFSKNRPKIFSLYKSNSVSVGMWDTFLDIYITSEDDVVLSTPGSGFSLKGWIILFTVVLVLGITSGLIAILNS